MNRSKDYRRLIDTTRWRRLRLEVLRRHPLCQDCEQLGVLSAATEVHHVTPVDTGIDRSQKEALCYDPNNLRALCHRCHVAAHKVLGRSGAAHTAGLRERRRELERAKLEGAALDSLLPDPGGDFFKGEGV